MCLQVLVKVNSSLGRPADIKEDGSRDSEFIIWETKTRNSIRNIPVPKELLSEISAHRIRQIEERMKLGIGGDPEYIFADALGNHILGTRANEALKRLLKSEGIPHRKFHALRHTFATGLVSRGADINTVMRLMGHSNINITAIYFHADKAQMRKAVNSLNAWFK